MTDSRTISAAAPATGRRQASSPYRGVVAAVFTPCQSPGVPDPDAMRTLAAHLTQPGRCDGLFVIGSTGEMPFLDEEDRRALVAAARQGADPRAVIYAGVSGTGVRQVLRHADHAARDGAHVAVVMAPFLLKLSQGELVAYVSRIADRCPIPVAIYHHWRMPSSFDVATMARLARHPNIVAMKDTSTDARRMADLAAATAGTGMALFQGSEFILRPSLEAGAAGFVTALASIAPEMHQQLLLAHRERDLPRAARLDQQVVALAQMFKAQEMAESFSYFAYTLRRAAQLRGWIAHTHGMLEGAEISPAFDDTLVAHLRSTGLVP